MSEIKAALTAEEWSWWYDEWKREEAVFSVTDDQGYSAELPKHQIAALCLHDQPFGFTREDIEVLCNVLEDLDDKMQRGPEGIEIYVQPKYDAVASLSARISALLPPDAK